LSKVRQNIASAKKAAWINKDVVKARTKLEICMTYTYCANPRNTKIFIKHIKKNIMQL
jgi:hypothetical protein